MIRIDVNDEPHELPMGSTLHNLLESVGHNRSGVAVAHNGQIVHRQEWTTRTLAQGDKVLLIVAAQGG